MKINEKCLNLKHILENGDILSIYDKFTKETINGIYIENLNLILFNGGGYDELSYYDDRLENEFFLVTKIKRIRLDKNENSDIEFIHKDIVMSLSENEIVNRVEKYIP